MIFIPIVLVLLAICFVIWYRMTEQKSETFHCPASTSHDLSKIQIRECPFSVGDVHKLKLISSQWPCEEGSCAYIFCETCQIEMFNTHAYEKGVTEEFAVQEVTSMWNNRNTNILGIYIPPQEKTD